MSKVKVKGKLTWIGEKEYKGRRYWRVGIVPEGEEEALFLNVNEMPGEKYEVVTVQVTEEALGKARAFHKSGTSGKSQTDKTEGASREVQSEGRAEKARETEARIAKAVALKAAADAIAAITHTDISSLGKNVLKLAAEFEDYLNGVGTSRVPF